MKEELALNPNKVVAYLGKPAKEFTKADIVRYITENGIRMEVRTDQPGLQLYSKETTVCLETQLFPDSPNNPTWPSSVLRPGETYRHRCIYSFSID